jgi:hypothetical protein
VASTRHVRIAISPGSDGPLGSCTVRANISTTHKLRLESAALDATYTLTCPRADSATTRVEVCHRNTPLAIVSPMPFNSHAAKTSHNEDHCNHANKARGGIRRVAWAPGPCTVRANISTTYKLRLESALSKATRPSHSTAEGGHATTRVEVAIQTRRSPSRPCHNSHAAKTFHNGDHCNHANKARGGIRRVAWAPGPCTVRANIINDSQAAPRKVLSTISDATFAHNSTAEGGHATKRVLKSPSNTPLAKSAMP